MNQETLKDIIGDSFVSNGRLRLGRGGRIIVDRCCPFTLEDNFDEDEALEPAYKVLIETETNPYAQWSNRIDLANKGLLKVEEKGQNEERVEEPKKEEN